MQKEKPWANQQELDTLKQERLDAFEAKVEQLALWEGIEARTSSYRSKYIDGILTTSPVSMGGYLTYKFGRWLYERIAYGDKKEEEIPLSPFPIANPVVYHFHPVSFVQQMRRIFEKYICKHITYEQAIYSYTAVKNNINNVAKEEHIINMQDLGVNVFDPLFEHFKGKIKINNMYRSKKLNKALKDAGYATSKYSQHMVGQAIDIDALAPYTNKDLFKYIVENLNFDQIIWERGTDANPDWVHVSYESKGNRKDKKQYKNKKKNSF